MLSSLAAAPPAAAAIVGWRGDGTGRYPDADPPTEWARVAKTVKALSAQSRKPRATDKGESIPDGVIRHWLVLGPVPIPAGAKHDSEYIPGEATLSPDENEKAAGSAWKPVSAESSWVDFLGLFKDAGKKPEGAAYAHAYIYSRGGKPLAMNLMFAGGLKCWLNGKQVHSNKNGHGARVRLKPVQGWNRLLLRCVPAKESWYINLVLFGAEPGEFETKNIVWKTRMPSVGYGAPIVVGDRVFVSSEPYDLVCVNKADGRILWVRSNNYFETTSPAERRADPRLGQLAPVAARVGEINAAYASPGGPTSAMAKEKGELQKKLNLAMRKIDRKKYGMAKGQDVGYAGVTPVSDGKHVYAWFATGVTACYDLDGNRKWMALDNHKEIEHGFSTSPLLVDGKVIVYMRERIAYDARSGKVVWRHLMFNPNKNQYYHFHGTGFVVPVGREKVIVYPNGEIVRVADGKTLFIDFWKVGGGPQQISSPVLDKGVVYKLKNDGKFMFFRIPAVVGDKVTPQVIRTGQLDTGKFPKFYGIWCNASPLCHNGLLYCVEDEGVLSVLDVNTGEVAYQKLLDADPFMHHNFKGRGGVASSPTLAGDHIYIWGNQGTTLVLEPGRKFKLVAKNRIEHTVWPNHWRERQEVTYTCPVFDGNRIYFRGEENLYCIGGPGKPRSSGTRSGRKPKARRPKAIPRVAKPVTDEQKARGLVSVAENYIRIGAVDQARAKLTEVLEKYPATQGARAAKEKLDELGTAP